MLVYNGIIYFAVRTGGQHNRHTTRRSRLFCKGGYTKGMCNKDEGIHVAGKSKLYAFKLDNLELIKR